MDREEVRNALIFQDVREVKRFLDQGLDLNQIDDVFKCNLLIYYCFYLTSFANKNHIVFNAILTLLSFRKHLNLEISANLELFSRERHQRLTALDWAAKRENFQIVHLLLQAGAGTHFALHVTADRRIQKMLLAAGANPSTKPAMEDCMGIHPETQEAAQEWLRSLECAQSELLKVFNDNEMLVQEVKDFIYTEAFLKEVIRA